MANLSFYLSEFPKDYFLFWTVSTQCEKKVYVKLSVNGKTFFEARKTDADKSLKVIRQDYGTITAANPELYIEVDDSSSLQQSMVSGLIADDRNQRVGFVYDYCIESGNEDLFNDVYINVVGWKQKG